MFIPLRAGFWGLGKASGGAEGWELKARLRGHDGVQPSPVTISNRRQAVKDASPKRTSHWRRLSSECKGPSGRARDDEFNAGTGLITQTVIRTFAHSLRAREEGDTFICYSDYSHYSDKMEATTIQVDRNIRDLLRSFGRKGETYNEIISKLIQRARYVEFMEESYRILETEDNWVSLDAL